MGNEFSTSSDSAAVFGAALSLWRASEKRADDDKHLNLSECYNGIDQFMREVMRIANLFEAWACRHIAFDELNDVWPYLLEDKFGGACLAVMIPTALAEFEASDCLRVALCMRLPIRVSNSLPVPIDLTASNPVFGSVFRTFRVRTMRDSLEDDYCVPFTSDDEPFDEEFGTPYFVLYGEGIDGVPEHIANRRTYAEALSLSRNLAPGIEFPEAPVLVFEN